MKNFNKRYRGVVFKKHLWPASRAYNQGHHEHHYNIMQKASPRAMKWIEDNHRRHEKSLPAIPLLDRIRQMIMEKQDIRKTLSSRMTDKILSQKNFML